MEWGRRGGGGGEEKGARRPGGGQARFLFSKIGILSFTAELTSPDIVVKKPSVRWCLCLS